MALSFEKHGPCALVTGAGSGIGEAFATALVAKGFEVVLVDVDVRALERVQAALGPGTRMLPLDLATERGLDDVREVLRDPRIGLVVSNAGVSHLGHFVDIPLADHALALDVNARAMLHVTHTAAQAMRARGRGGILMLSSNSGLLHSPFVASYAGTKAYALALGEAIHEELRPFGVDVLVVIPGLTRTAGLDKQSLDTRVAGKLLVMPEVVAERALAALGETPRVFPNVRDRMGAAILMALSPARALALTAQTMKRFFPRQLG